MKIKIISFLAAGTPGFSEQEQITAGLGYHTRNVFYFLFCDWQTAWRLLYKPIDVEEKKEIYEILKVDNQIDITLSHL